MSGNTSELGDICKSSGKSSLFFLTFIVRIFILAVKGPWNQLAWR